MKKSLSQRVKDLLLSIPQDERLHNTLICNALWAWSNGRRCRWGRGL